MNPTYRAYFDLAAAMTIVGSSVVVGKIIVTDFPIFMALTIRFAIALPLLLFVSHRRRILALPPVRVLTQVFLQALTSVFLFNVLLLAGLRFTTAAQSGLLLCLPVGIVQIARFDLQSITTEQILVLLYYGVFVSALAYYLWFRGLENASTGAAGILSAMLPISAVGLSAVILGEALTPAHLLGLVLVLSAVAMMTLGSNIHPERKGETRS